ncbi:PfkB family carbohydrate kinase [Actinotignum urinale]|uniref:PfkB family carbohydrate kinase n=1 Tax=Actinotignum urinale TaxID=190146 RepID=A0AAW9HQ03_9ACTO|nr:PfkB family carbohydrate kinase [Actinotignum urinale]MDY5154757.1 PfkB family carbohydrate kinase [Actinotignum urinale]
MKLKDIAEIAGVSQSTISKIVNGKDAGISADTRDRVLQIVREYHYTPYGSNKITGKSWKIAVILREVNSVDTTLEGVLEVAQDEGYATLVYDSQASLEQERKNVAALRKHRVDCVIWEPVSQESLDLSAEINEYTEHLLTIGRVGGDESLLLPYEDAGYNMTMELVKRGHEKIGVLITKGRRTKRFLQGVEHCLRDYGLDVNKRIFVENIDKEAIGLIADKSATAFVSTHYLKAVEFVQCAESYKYHVPQDVSIVAVKSDDKASYLFSGSPEISTFSIRSADFGKYLCKKIISELENRQEKIPSFSQGFELDNDASIDSPPRENQKKIVVVGTISLDSYLNGKTIPSVDYLTKYKMLTTFPGGKGLTQAVGVARLGHQPFLIGKVGVDRDGDRILHLIQKEHVDFSGVERDSAMETGKSMIFVDSRGESAVSVIPGINESVTASYVAHKEHLFVDASCCLIQTDVSSETVVETLKIANRNNLLTIVKPVGSSILPIDCYSLVHVMVPNTRELDYIVQGAGNLEEKTEELLERGVEVVIVTCGKEGCYVRTRKISRYVASSCDDAVDTTGASDAFISALAVALVEGDSIEEAVRSAQIAAEYNVKSAGAISSLIDRHTFDILREK